MNSRAEQAARAPWTRAQYREAPGMLGVWREPNPAAPVIPGQPRAVTSDPSEGPELLLAVFDDGSVVALHGHVDLGTGLRTALAQLVAEELELPLSAIQVVMGHTDSAPNQGPTIASASLQIHGLPLRCAAAQARAWLLQAAATHWDLPLEGLSLDHAQVWRGGAADRGCNAPLPWSMLIGDQHHALRLDLNASLKPTAEHRVIGQPVPRVDIAAKALGQASFVHDVRLPGMLHGRVIRPPYAGADHGDFIGRTLESVDRSSIAHLDGVRAVVVSGDFVGVVADSEHEAELAQRALRVQWKRWPGIAGLDDVGQAVRANPSTPRRLVDEGAIDAALDGAAVRLERDYLWPYQMHASIGPSCAVAQWQGEAGSDQRLTVWAGTQNPHVLRADLAQLTGLADTAVSVVRWEASGCYGRNGADDVAADAALLARAVAAPVRVQLTREQEHAWEPKGAAQWMSVRGGLTDDGAVAAYDFQTAYPSNGAPLLAALLTRAIEPVAQAFEMGDRTARPPYRVPNLRVTVNDMAPILRASWLRGVSALPNSFAHESYVDELAAAAGADPVDFRLRHLDDPRASELVRATADRAGWLPHVQSQQRPAEGGWLQGQGFAYARYIHSKWPGFGAAWAAWVADVEVHPQTGEVHVKRVVVGHDAGLVVNPDGVTHQVHGNVLQTTSRALKEKVQTDPQTGAVASQEWGGYPILNFRDVPVIEVMHMPRQGEAPLGAGESSSVPGTAAIANAIYDATGVRLRQPPFTPDVVRAALAAQREGGALATAGASAGPTGPGFMGRDEAPSVAPESEGRSDPIPLATPAALPAAAIVPRRRGATSALWALAVGVAGFVLGALGMWGARSPIAPVAPVPAGAAPVYAAATLARGAELAAVGDCAVCHTTEGGVPMAGGRAMVTPFGVVYSTNLTPDLDTGLGAWSYPAFERAMRHGVSRDGHLLYPAFPYTAFAHMSDADMTALYAYLQSLTPVAATTPEARMRGVLGWRPLMAGWNALFHRPADLGQPAVVDPPWQRGAELVNGLGHCGACHSPRHALGAERGGEAWLSGGEVDGWIAPALTARSLAPVPWTERSLIDYLRGGYSAEHGAALGPMAEVVRSLRGASDADIAAMARYLASFSTAPGPGAVTAPDLVRAAARRLPVSWLGSPGQRLFDGACSACHHDGDGPKVWGVNVPLALNTGLHAPQPDNLIRVILDGVRQTPSSPVGFMAGFRHSLSDTQVAELAAYMRARFAPQRPAWSDLSATVARLRAAGGGLPAP